MILDEHNQGNNPMYTREFQTMLDGLDEEGCIEESGHVSEKKRRLSVDQVKALEKNFEVENKLEPERKVKLAQELGLQPRQVAVWFQNRRARWKTKQLERDYGLLKANYDALKLNFETLQRDNESLVKEIGELKSKLNDDAKSSSKSYAKEEDQMVSDTEEKCKGLELKTSQQPIKTLTKCDDNGEDEEAAAELNFEDFNNNNNNNNNGSSDSDSSAILNDDMNNSPNHDQFLNHNFHNGGSNSSCSMNISCLQFPDPNKAYHHQPQFVKIEEHNFLGEESCSTLFSDDQPPTLHWYCSDQWN
ncbi:hypothetical protein BUALT_Bualt11G0020800 [Buddleja alternifolia]|uniref:Homeobox-leucine zipper protein n=1 Tax=Buddleja alternifolia TaxID=168488 RepID=A0AAV6WTJ3_9LAMI|nr:hypothetical protein BUALT_Bualt11G0020800 [Buddleja alternifolia]